MNVQTSVQVSRPHRSVATDIYLRINVWGADGWQFAAAIVDDVKALLSCGRPAIVCAITDLRRMFAAAIEEAKRSNRAASHDRLEAAEDGRAAETLTNGSSANEKEATQRSVALTSATQQQQPQQSESKKDCKHHAHVAQGCSISRRDGAKTRRHHARRAGVSQGMGDRRLRAQLQTSERKLAFFQSWANEQTREAYQRILEATVGTQQTFQRTPDSPVDPRAAAAMVGRAPGTAVAQPLCGSRQERPRIEELSECNGVASSRIEAVSSDADCAGSGHVAAVSELDYDALDLNGCSLDWAWA